MPSSGMHRPRHQTRLTPSPGSSSGGGRVNGGVGTLAVGDSGRIFTANDDYLTTRKVKTKMTRNTEREVRRRLVLPDGRVIAEAEPEVTVDTVEDETTRHEIDDGGGGGGGPFDLSAQPSIAALPRVTLSSNASSSKNSAAGWSRGRHHRHDNEVVDSSFTRRVNTHDVREAVTTTAAGGRVVGHVRRKDIDRAIRDRKPIEDVVVRYDGRGQRSRRRGRHRSEGDAVGRTLAIIPAEPRVLHSSKSRKKVVDTEDVRNVSRRGRDGKVTTETVRTHKHEVFDDKETPDEDGEEWREERREADRQRYSHNKRDNYVEYFTSDGRMVGRGPRVTAEERRIEIDDDGRRERRWEELSEKVRRNRRKMRQRIEQEEAAAAAAAAEAARRDALTKRPLNYVHEEKVKKKETDKWLERHFGSEWSLTNSNNSSGLGHSRTLKTFKSGNQSAAAVGRSMSFTSIPIVYQGKSQERRRTEDGGEEVTTTREKMVKTTTKTFHRPASRHDRAIERLDVQTRSAGGVDARKEASSGRATKAVTHSFVHHLPESSSRWRDEEERCTTDKYRKYNSTQCLLPTPQVDYSLHGGSTIVTTTDNNADYVAEQRRSRTAEGLRRRQQQQQQHSAWERSQSVGTKRHQQQYDASSRFVARREDESSRSTPSLLLAAQPPPPSPFQDKQIDFGKIRRIYPTWERDHSSINGGGGGFDYYNSFASTLKRGGKNHQRTVAVTTADDSNEWSRRPLYVTELKREKLYPTTSENNLLFDFHQKVENNRMTTTTKDRGGKSSSHRARFAASTPRNYLGFRSLERSDAVSARSSSSLDESSATAAGMGAGEELHWWSEMRQERRGKTTHKRKRKRSQSFAAKASPRFTFLGDEEPRERADGGGGFFGDEFVYDRFERRFVAADDGAIRRGHSDLRLDKGAANAPAPATAEDYYFYKNPRYAHDLSDSAAAGGKRHLRELVRTTSRGAADNEFDDAPQRYKTIIFLSGR